MKAYIVVDIEVLDREQFESYRPIATQTIAQYGGKYIIRGAPPETLEGSWSPKRLVVVEFPSVEQAKAWYNSPEYSEGKGIRQKSSRSKMVLVEGLAD